MSSWLGLDKILLGVDLDEEQRRSDAADAELARLNAEALERGRISQESYEQREANREAGAINVVDSVNDEFKAGLAEGLSNVTSGVKNTLSGTIGTIFGTIPWSVWLLAAVALFIWMGGLEMLRGRLARK